MINNIADYMYKVVLVSREQNTYYAIIFCSESGKWSKSTLFSNPFHVVGGFIRDSFASNDVIYWVVLQREYDKINDIIAFNPFNDDITDPKRCRIIHLPDGLKPSYKDKVRLRLVCGRLRLSELVKAREASFLALKIWLLNSS